MHCVYVKQQEWMKYVPSTNASWPWRMMCRVRDKLKAGYVGTGWLQNGNKYSVKKGYQWLCANDAKVGWHKMVWNKYAVQSHCFFGWLALLKRLKTRDMLVKMGICH